MKLHLEKTTVYEAIRPMPEGSQRIPFVLVEYDSDIFIYSDEYSRWFGFPFEGDNLNDDLSFSLGMDEIEKECFLLIDQEKEEITRAFNKLKTWINTWENRTDETEFTSEESDIFNELKKVFPYTALPFKKMTDEYFCELVKAYQDLKNAPKKKPKKKGKKK